MPKYCANLTWLFQELPFVERFQAAADAGFTGVEVLFPYDGDAQQIRSEILRYDLSMVLINTPPPNYTGGERGFAAVPELRDRFRRDFKRVLRYAQVLQPEIIHIMSGAAEGPEAEAIFIDNLKWAVDEAPGQTLSIEVINPVDMEGYFLSDYDLAARVLDAVGAKTLTLQFDTYHAHKITGDVGATWAQVNDLVGHIQVGDVTTRAEPGRDVFDHAGFLAQLEAEGYQDWVSGEYKPAGRTVDGLDWRV